LAFNKFDWLKALLKTIKARVEVKNKIFFMSGTN
jgi:hypothetical protein